jgi:hypothetical protein
MVSTFRNHFCRDSSPSPLFLEITEKFMGRRFGMTLFNMLLTKTEGTEYMEKSRNALDFPCIPRLEKAQ